MKFLTKAALAALLAGSIGVAGLVPTYADSAAPDNQTAPSPSQPSPGQPSALPHPGRGFPGPWGMWRGQRSMSARGGSPLLRLACSDRGTEALDLAFVRVKYELKLTAEQQPLFDTLHTAALADQKSFADTCKAAVDDGVAPGKKTLLDRMQTELALDSAKVTALSDVVPKFKAFYDSLSDQQKADLQHLRPGRARFGQWQQGPWGQGWGQGMMHHMHPAGSDATPAAPDMALPAPDAAPGVPNPPSAAPATTPSQS
jgi:LTXXQ motif family protein